MKKFYNLKYKNKIYKIRDKVLLLLKNIYIKKVSKKLTNKFLKLFKIKKLIDKNIYQLIIFKSYKRIYYIFHISLLELYYKWKSIKISESVKIQNKNK